MMTRNEMQRAPETGLWNVSGLKVPVRVLDVRTVWSRMDYLIAPVGGAGQIWVNAERVAEVRGDAR